MIVIDLGPEFHRTIASMALIGRNIRPAAGRGLARGLKGAADHIVKNHLSGQDLKRRTGNLARSVDFKMLAELHGIVGPLKGSAVEAYKWLLGSGKKTIRPKKGKYLAIPIGEALTPAGMPRYSGPGDPRLDGGFFFTSKAGNLIFGIRRGKTKRAKIRPLFVLKTEVTIEGRDSLAQGVVGYTDKIADAMQDEIGKELQK